MSELRSLLDQLAAVDLARLDPDELTDGEVLDGIPLLQSGLNQLNSLLTRLVGAADRREAQRADGMVSMKSWLTGHCRLSGREATALLRDARRLPGLPALAAAYAAGEVSAAHVGVDLDHLRAARPAARRRARAADGQLGDPASRRGTGPALRRRRLYGPTSLVRRPPSLALGLRRPTSLHNSGHPQDIPRLVPLA